LLGQLLELARKYDVATVTLFSDHGQNLGETTPFLGHSSDNGPRQGFLVPVIMWIGKSAQFNQAQGENLVRNAKAPFQTDQLFATLLELYGIDTEDRALRNSLLSEGYRPVKRACDGMQ
jgi:glucan phosphoethanolaminetransferase (alkaline phosphatase superfamily)